MAWEDYIEIKLFLKYKTVLKILKILNTFIKNKIFILVIYTENKPSADYTQRWG
jgi:hypothetical protein